MPDDDLWSRLRAIPEAFAVSTPGFGEALLLPVPGLGPQAGAAFWMIAPYKDQTRLAHALRTDPTAQQFITEHKVHLGFRETDVPPMGLNRQERYGSTILGLDADTNFQEQRRTVLSLAANPHQPAPMNRRSDREENVRLFWGTQTPQSHHIVEFNHLRDLGVSNQDGEGPLDHGQLPCVLLMAEWHQRYVSRILKQTHGWDPTRLRSALAQTYASLYQTGGAALRPLWEVSQIILRAAGLEVP